MIEVVRIWLYFVAHHRVQALFRLSLCKVQFWAITSCCVNPPPVICLDHSFECPRKHKIPGLLLASKLIAARHVKLGRPDVFWLGRDQWWAEWWQPMSVSDENLDMGPVTVPHLFV